jgi:putative oxidoreductase
MVVNKEIDTWYDHNRHVLIDALRIVVGIILIMKGYFFLSHSDEMHKYLAAYHLGGMVDGIALLIAWVNLTGGFFIMIGLITRIAALFQIPILFGGIISVNLSGGSAASSDLLLTVLLFFLCLFFAIEGSGRFSIQNVLFKKNVPEVKQPD